MPNKFSNNQKGVTLIEVLIYVVLSLVVLTAIFQMLDSNRATFLNGETRMNVQQNGRVGMDEISRELRMAGYYPENFDADPGNNLSNVSAVQLATHTALAVYGDVDGSGASNVFLFCLNGSVVRRIKATSGTVAAYTCSGGDVLASYITGLRFSYYDANNVTIPAPATSTFQLDGQALGAVPSFATVVQRNAVRRVAITLTVRRDVPRQAPQIYTLTSDVRLRNLN